MMLELVVPSSAARMRRERASSGDTYAVSVATPGRRAARGATAAGGGSMKAAARGRRFGFGGFVIFGIPEGYS